MRTLRKQAGVALVTAIFLLVVLAGLAVAVVSLTTSQQDSAVKDELGTRAYLAAKAGVEWALYTALIGGPDHYNNLNCANPVTFRMPQGTTLSSFNVTVSCTVPSAAESFGSGDAADPTAGHFRITAIACTAPAGTACPVANPGPDYVQRTVNAQL